MDDLISRQNVLRCLTDISYNLCKTQGEADVIDIAKTMVITMPPHSQTCNKLATDCISRQAAIDAVETKIKKWNAVDGEGYHVGLGLRYTDVIDKLAELPSAQPEYKTDEWCHDCKEYDKEHYRCPRWNHVIRRTVEEMKAVQPEIIMCKDCKHREEKPIADGRYWCELHDTFMYYCSDAERRTDG